MKRIFVIIAYACLGSFIGFIVGQLLSIPFMLMARSDPGVPEVQGNPAMYDVATITCLSFSVIGCLPSVLSFSD